MFFLGKFDWKWKRERWYFYESRCSFLAPTTGSFNFHQVIATFIYEGDFHFYVLYVLITSIVEQIRLLLMVQENYLSWTAAGAHRITLPLGRSFKVIKHPDFRFRSFISEPVHKAERGIAPLPELSWANKQEMWDLMVKKESGMYMRHTAEGMLSRHPALQPRMRAILLGKRFYTSL